MSLEIIGKLLVKQEVQIISDKFKKREFVLELSEEINGNTYTNYAKMELSQAKCDILDRYNEGDIVKVSFNIKGRRWEKDGKVTYFSNLDAWRIEAANATQNASAPVNTYSQPTPTYSAPAAGGFNQPQSAGASQEAVDDLPF